MKPKYQKPVMNYKNACLLMGFVNLMWVFAAIWTFYGMPAVLVLGAVLNHLITRWDLKLARRQYYGQQ